MVERLDFVAQEVVLRNADVGFEDFPLGRLSPGGQAHRRMAGGSAASNDFGGSLAGDRDVEFVLHGGEEFFRSDSVRRVIGGRGVDIGNLLIDHAFAGADFADLFEQLFKVTPVESGAVLEAVGINGEALENVVFQTVGGPGAEVGGARALDAVTDGDDGLEAIEGDRADDVPLALYLNYRGFLGSCGRIEFLFGKDVFEMEGDIVGGALI